MSAAPFPRFSSMGMWSSVFPHEFEFFNAMDGDLYALLVRELFLHPSVCRAIMALWLWFERTGVADLLSKIFSLSPRIITQLVDEAVTCLKVIGIRCLYRAVPELAEIPLTCTLLGAEGYLEYFRENQQLVFEEVVKLRSDMYAAFMCDLEVRSLNGEFGMRWDQPPSQPRLSPAENLVENFSRLTLTEDLSARLKNEMLAFERTLFMSFRTSPVTETEIRDFFTRMFGCCIESVHIHEVRRGEKPLYARICFLQPSFVQNILNGMCMIRLVISGKMVSVVPYLSRIGRTLSACGCFMNGPSICPHPYFRCVLFATGIDKLPTMPWTWTIFLHKEVE
ncbi:uncharacterized protein LOC127239731 isoform X1 [Andrographis paniculata]|uniref:uncharacterized protein LOC127239731 isoform X1 n=1 Tax=Andrographis paniculata TaxID=175694 RepID=UPI0021E82849|nr:uncharacterized protein LOC127239731 isoform X1 [Andrographis paniculata]XP_051113970.1 uncharacterized protein LOC127239731 isoform X1 [Andrographis paniculata]XP_051113971.1 uncharacterized protein LOC127239731 isoform X1 [Andrographis paniculata]XP_051113972.1 uncharacterized protein LOC127239731 isoform X1 [Andrographis paniculata]XP_051113973.1 uncharacterized protein LOC127239731 isoform X1 [Andrographis paniculata]